jgi:hypothetical protein
MSEIEICCASSQEGGEHRHSHFSLDRLGIGVSLACLIHCLALPLLLIFLPFGQLFTRWHLPFHILIFLLAAPTAYVSLRQGYRHHRQRVILILGALGCLLIFSNVIFDFLQGNSFHHHHEHGDAASFSLVWNVAGGILLALAHTLNLRGCRRPVKPVKAIGS